MYMKSACLTDAHVTCLYNSGVHFVVELYDGMMENFVNNLVLKIYMISKHRNYCL